MTHVILKPMGLQTPTLMSSLFLQHLQHLTSRPCLQELSKQLHYEGVGEKSRPIDLAAGSLALIFFCPKKVVSRLWSRGQKWCYSISHLGVGNSNTFDFYPWKKIIQFEGRIFLQMGWWTNHQPQAPILADPNASRKSHRKRWGLTDDWKVQATIGDDRRDIQREIYDIMSQYNVSILYIPVYNPIQRYVYLHIII